MSRKSPVAITLTIEEWVALCAILLGKPLSDKGATIARDATRTLLQQLAVQQLTESQKS
jgi:hypothetical protein